MPLSQDLLLVAAGAVAASVNAAAGGGTLLSFPALLAIGLSPLAANATSTVGLLPGGLGSTFGLRAELDDQRDDAFMVAVTSAIGGVLGAVLLLALGGAVFAAVVPMLLLVASGLLLLQPLVARLATRNRFKGLREDPRPESRPLKWLVNFIIAIYGGYFGAGQGILFLGAMGLLFSKDLRRVNALKVLSALLANFIGAVVFIVAELWKHPHAVVWRPVVPLAIGSLVGGYFAVRLVQKLPPAALRAFASAVGLAIAVYFVFFKR